MGMRYGTWNVRSFYRAGSLRTVPNELEKYNLDLAAVQEVRWVADGSHLANDHTFFLWNWKC